MFESDFDYTIAARYLITVRNSNRLLVTRGSLSVMAESTEDAADRNETLHKIILIHEQKLSSRHHGEVTSEIEAVCQNRKYHLDSGECINQSLSRSRFCSMQARANR